MTKQDRNKLTVIASVLFIVAIAAGLYMANNFQNAAASSPRQNEQTNIVKNVWSVIKGSEKTTTTNTLEVVMHSHDGLPQHKHVVNVEVAVTETTPHGTFHDFPATQTDAPAAVPNATGNETGHVMPGQGAAATDGQQIMIMNREFMGGTLTVAVGTKVTWVNMDSETHTVTSDTGLFNGMLNLNDSFSFTFTEAGTYKYHCENRPEMTGTITVK